jgi:hypothetical protein
MEFSASTFATFCKFSCHDKYSLSGLNKGMEAVLRNSLLDSNIHMNVHKVLQLAENQREIFGKAQGSQCVSMTSNPSYFLGLSKWHILKQW